MMCVSQRCDYQSFNGRMQDADLLFRNSFRAHNLALCRDGRALRDTQQEASRGSAPTAQIYNGPFV